MDIKEYLNKLENWYELIISNKEEIEYLKELSTYTSYDDLKLKIRRFYIWRNGTICGFIKKKFVKILTN